jgi:hypothetical protein
LPLIRQ